MVPEVVKPIKQVYLFAVHAPEPVQDAMNGTERLRERELILLLPTDHGKLPLTYHADSADPTEAEAMAQALANLYGEPVYVLGFARLEPESVRVPDTEAELRSPSLPDPPAPANA